MSSLKEGVDQSADEFKGQTTLPLSASDSRHCGGLLTLRIEWEATVSVKKVILEFHDNPHLLRSLHKYCAQTHVNPGYIYNLTR